jgi:hypothetical protein
MAMGTARLVHGRKAGLFYVLLIFLIGQIGVFERFPVNSRTMQANSFAASFLSHARIT